MPPTRHGHRQPSGRTLRCIALFSVLATGCSRGSVLKTAGDNVAAATTTSSVNLWIVWDGAAHHEPLEGEFDCLVNHTDFNDIVATWRKSPYRSNQLIWDPAHGHGGSTTVSAGACGQLFAPNPQCLVNAVLDDPKVGVPQDGDVFLYIVPGQCGGGNDNGGSNDQALGGTAVRGAGGKTIHVVASTVGDGTGDNFLLCQERVAVHEAFESITDVSSADCCTGQTPDNLCPQCSQSCGQFWSNSAGPAGFGSNTITCNGVNYASQKVEPWTTQANEWLPQFCRGAVAKSSGPPACGCYAGNDGDYCGSAANDFAAKNNCTLPSKLNPDFLYHCSDGNWTVKQQCTTGCAVNTAKNTPDKCNPPACGCYAGNDGDYCGSAANDYAAKNNCSLPSNFNPDFLYHCSNGTWTVKEQCTTGCAVNTTPNTPDKCNPPACGCYAGNDGDYCGSAANDYAAKNNCSLPSNFNPDFLYHCSDGNWTVKEQCTAGCAVNTTPNTPDKCNPPPCGCYIDDPGDYCGSAALDWAANHDCTLPSLSLPGLPPATFDPDWLYHCSGGNWSVKQECAMGCAVAMDHTQDQCK